MAYFGYSFIYIIMRAGKNKKYFLIVLQFLILPLSTLYILNTLKIVEQLKLKVVFSDYLCISHCNLSNVSALKQPTTVHFLKIVLFTSL